MSIIVWIIIGALAGWLASIVMKTNAEQGAVGNVIVGIFGAVIGGFVMKAITGEGIGGFNLKTIIVATLGAIILLALMRAFRRPAYHA